MRETDTLLEMFNMQNERVEFVMETEKKQKDLIPEHDIREN